MRNFRPRTRRTLPRDLLSPLAPDRPDRRTGRAPGPTIGAAAAVLLGIAAAVAIAAISAPAAWNDPPPDPATPPPLVARLEGPEPIGLFEAPDRLVFGDTLSRVLTRNGFSSREAHEVGQAVSSVHDVKDLQPGQILWVERDRRGHPSGVRLTLADLTQVSVVRTDGGWNATSEGVETEFRRDVVGGEVESSLYQGVVSTGATPDLAVMIARALEFDFDFHRQTRRGDTFGAVVETRYRPDGQRHDYGALQAVRYVNNGNSIYAIRFEFPDGSSGYYDYEGHASRREFLSSPLEYGRVTSGFSSRRFHPVHRVYRPHYGVDYGAPVGTPVMATAAGVVTDAGRRGPNGNMVTVRHTGGYETKYLHLSRIRVRAGQRVAQRDIVGNVGQTGTATGPHLDYRLYRHGTPVNPTTHVTPPGPPISDEYRAAFVAWRDELVAALDGKGHRRPRGAGASRITEE